MPKAWNLAGRIDHGASPFTAQDAGFVWCPHCLQDVKPETAVGDRDGVHVYRRRCLRCGNVLQYGIDRRRLLSSEPLPAAALRFVQDTAPDRR